MCVHMSVCVTCASVRVCARIRQKYIGKEKHRASSAAIAIAGRSHDDYAARGVGRGV